MHSLNEHSYQHKFRPEGNIGNAIEVHALGDPINIKAETLDRSMRDSTIFLDHGFGESTSQPTGLWEARIADVYETTTAGYLLTGHQLIGRKTLELRRGLVNRAAGILPEPAENCSAAMVYLALSLEDSIGEVKVGSDLDLPLPELSEGGLSIQSLMHRLVEARPWLEHSRLEVW